jgi:hypothetical protein
VIFVLDVDVKAGFCVEKRMLHQRRLMNQAVQHFARTPDVFERGRNHAGYYYRTHSKVA